MAHGVTIVGVHERVGVRRWRIPTSALMAHYHPCSDDTTLPVMITSRRELRPPRWRRQRRHEEQRAASADPRRTRAAHRDPDGSLCRLLKRRAQQSRQRMDGCRANVQGEPFPIRTPTSESVGFRSGRPSIRHGRLSPPSVASAAHGGALSGCKHAPLR